MKDSEAPSRVPDKCTNDAFADDFPSVLPVPPLPALLVVADVSKSLPNGPNTPNTTSGHAHFGWLQSIDPESALQQIDLGPLLAAVLESDAPALRRLLKPQGFLNDVDTFFIYTPRSSETDRDAREALPPADGDASPRPDPG